jgi:hypothetical protein
MEPMTLLVQLQMLGPLIWHLVGDVTSRGDDY